MSCATSLPGASMSEVRFSVPCERMSTAHRPRTVRTRTGRTMTYAAKQYTRWKAIVREHVSASGWTTGWTPSCFVGRIGVHIVADTPDRRPRDLDNIAKGILDALNGVLWADDSQVDRLAIIRGRSTRAGTVRVVVVSLPEEDKT